MLFFIDASTINTVTTQHIDISPDIAGGKPRIAGHRITVQNIVLWYERLRLTADEIATNHGVSLADFYAALAYCYDHRQEIDEAILADETYIAELQSRTTSKLSGKIGG
ncbi:MAG: DUF433 domain-containing protein [Nitrospira sp.]|nr:DUF433 domain-containing protein [Nitrospira sp.]